MLTCSSLLLQRFDDLIVGLLTGFRLKREQEVVADGFRCCHDCECNEKESKEGSESAQHRVLQSLCGKYARADRADQGG